MMRKVTGNSSQKASNKIPPTFSTIIYPVAYIFQLTSVQSLSRVSLCNPMDCSTPGFPVHRQLLELTRTHVHQVGDAIQPSHPLLSLSLPVFNLCLHQVFSNEPVLHITWPKFGVSASTSVLPKNVQNWSPLGWTGWISLQSKGLSGVFSNTTIQKHQFFSAQLSL